MPKYDKSDIRYTIREEEFKKIMMLTPLPRDRLFLSILYCTGARPSEISGDAQRGLVGVTWGSIDVNMERGEMIFKIPISKIKKGSFAIKERKLVMAFNKENPEMPVRIIFDALIIEEKMAKREKREIDIRKPIFDFSRRTGYNIVSKAGKIIGVNICPYNFRHSRLTLLSEMGAGIETLMYFKGSKNISSIAPYLHAKEVKFKI